jgi:transposase
MMLRAALHGGVRLWLDCRWICSSGENLDDDAGQDVSLRSVAICIVDAKGKVVLERNVTFEIAEIAACLNRFAQPLTLVVFDAGAMRQHLFSGLKSAGFETVCMQARHVNAAL